MCRARQDAAADKSTKGDYRRVSVTLYTHDGPECISSYPYTVYSRATVYTETRMGYFIVGAGHVINAIIEYNGTIIFN